ncbi:MAG TPA: biopolymer transporter ExbD [Planctomycetota bacterium]|nr:biopolymer transporter ExbD [Planctomycetota bacterium]
MSMGVSKPGGKKTQTPEINVTPLVDVMLVLLVIFMITIQAARESIPLELPEAHGIADDGSKTPVEIHLDSEGRVHANGRVMELAEAEEELPRMLKGNEKQTYALNAHRKLPYEKVIKLISAIRGAGIETVLVTVDGAGPSGGPVR